MLVEIVEEGLRSEMTSPNLDLDAASDSDGGDDDSPPEDGTESKVGASIGRLSSTGDELATEGIIIGNDDDSPQIVAFLDDDDES